MAQKECRVKFTKNLLHFYASKASMQAPFIGRGTTGPECAAWQVFCCKFHNVHVCRTTFPMQSPSRGRCNWPLMQHSIMLQILAWECVPRNISFLCSLHYAGEAQLVPTTAQHICKFCQACACRVTYPRPSSSCRRGTTGPECAAKQFLCVQISQCEHMPRNIF